MALLKLGLAFAHFSKLFEEQLAELLRVLRALDCQSLLVHRKLSSVVHCVLAHDYVAVLHSHLCVDFGEHLLIQFNAIFILPLLRVFMHFDEGLGLLRHVLLEANHLLASQPLVRILRLDPLRLKQFSGSVRVDSDLVTNHPSYNDVVRELLAKAQKFTKLLKVVLGLREIIQILLLLLTLLSFVDRALFRSHVLWVSGFGLDCAGFFELLRFVSLFLFFFDLGNPTLFLALFLLDEFLLLDVGVNQKQFLDPFAIVQLFFVVLRLDIVQQVELAVHGPELLVVH